MDEYEYEELEVATHNFSSYSLVGKGSHGCVYKGTLKDGKVVAIKKQSSGLQKLEDNKKLNNEVRILSSLPQNPHLINLLGTSHDSANNQVLVMEHMPNGTLHDLLHVGPTTPLWPKRAQIAMQITRAVHFLHEAKPLIIHRDLKSDNILFDLDWNAKLVDFGLAVRTTHDSGSPPAGTIGYLDPCYTTPSKLSPKTDVFSFGVVLLEIITCTKAIDVCRFPASIVEWAMPFIRGNRGLEICDKRVVLPRYMEGTISQILRVAARCVSLKEDNRPSMAEIVTEMESFIVERARFSMWMNPVRSFIFFKRRRKVDTTTSSTVTCAIREANGHVDISRGKLLLWEILADTTH